jgi:hypothetical protein
MSPNAPCPSPDDLLRVELGELSVNKSTALRAHVDSCAACGATRAALRQLTDDLVGVSAPADDAQAFVARVEAAARAQPRPPAWAAQPSWSWGRRAPVFALAAAALVLVPAGLTIGLRSRLGGESAPPVVGTVAARGRAAVAGRVAAEVLLVRDGRLQPLDGQTVCGAEALAVRVTNLSGRVVQVMAFGRDAAGDVHWLYPGYLDARTNPASVAIADGVKERVLDEIVQPEAPASGPMRFVTLLSSNPLKVKEVEARLAAADPAGGIARLFPDAVARESTALCKVRR